MSQGLKVELVVVIADDALDAIVIALLLHKLNGRRVAGLFRPSKLGVDNVGENLSTYIHSGFKQGKYLVVVD